ncbi:hypothetical protein GEV33_005579 [Tenebrio molitor]|uniref:Uncharacterized protein n=1 Tax=Tenebrio molitor TaxID=7067 RepID=A0A8J6HMX8_TENMO|nr:hypothetical protein GEV33_005579 [Tenebrio molitor]
MLRVPAVTPFRPFNCKWTGPHQAKLGRNTTSTDSVLRLHLFKIHHPTGGGYRTIIPPSGAQQQWLQTGAVTKYRSANSGSLGFPNRRDAQQTISRAETYRQKEKTRNQKKISENLQLPHHGIVISKQFAS